MCLARKELYKFNKVIANSFFWNEAICDRLLRRQKMIPRNDMESRINENSNNKVQRW